MNYILGTNSTKIDVFPLHNLECPACDSQNSMLAARQVKYFHILSIPFFPVGRFTSVTCAKCHKTFTENQFTPQMRSMVTEREIIFKKGWRVWHFLGLFLIAGLLIFGTYTMNFIESVKNAGSKKSEEDNSYSAQYDRDVEKLTNRPGKKTDSIAYRIKHYIDANVTDKLDRFSFKYFTRVKDGRILVLMEVGDLDKVSTEGRKEFISLIEDALYESDYTVDKGAYIGILDGFDTELVTTPSYQTIERSFNPEVELYEFYNDEIDTIIKDTIQ